MKSTGYFSLVNPPPEYSPGKNQSIFTDPNDNDCKKTTVFKTRMIFLKSVQTKTLRHIPCQKTLCIKINRSKVVISFYR